MQVPVQHVRRGAVVSAGTGTGIPYILKVALAWAKAGQRVFFVHPNKVPLKGSHAYKDASCDPVRVWEMFEAAAARGVQSLALAWVPGPEFIAVDVDVKNGRNGWRTLERLSGYAPAALATLNASTPSGGKLLLYRVSEEWRERLREGGGALGSGVDVRYLTGFVVIPPAWGRRWNIPEKHHTVRELLERAADFPGSLATPLLRSHGGGGPGRRCGAGRDDNVISRCMVSCPVHAAGRIQRTPALQVSLTDDGRILFFCFAGTQSGQCSEEKIREAFGLDWVDCHGFSGGGVALLDDDAAAPGGAGDARFPKGGTSTTGKRAPTLPSLPFFPCLCMKHRQAKKPYVHGAGEGAEALNSIPFRCRHCGGCYADETAFLTWGTNGLKAVHLFTVKRRPGKRHKTDVWLEDWWRSNGYGEPRYYGVPIKGGREFLVIAEAPGPEQSKERATEQAIRRIWRAMKTKEGRRWGKPIGRHWTRGDYLKAHAKPVKKPKRVLDVDGPVPDEEFAAAFETAGCDVLRNPPGAADPHGQPLPRIRVILDDLEDPRIGIAEAILRGDVMLVTVTAA